MKLKLSRITLFFVLVVLSFSSCKKSTLIGSDLLPASDDINGIFTDTLSLNTKTVSELPLKTSTNTKFPVGVMNDNVFGKTSASLYTQFQIAGQIDLGNPDSLFVDSLVLNLPYAGSYGKFTNSQNIYVYRVTEAMNNDSSYYSDKTFSVDPTEVGRRMDFIPDLTHGIIDDGDSIAASMRIRLADHLGQDLLNQSRGANFQSNDAFQNYFKGLLVVSDTNVSNAQGCVYVSITSTSDSRLTVYYHNYDSTGLKFSFTIGNKSNSFSHYSHNYSSAPIQNALGSTNASDSVVYLQGGAGVKTKITFPTLSNLGNILVNKAELFVYVPAEYLDPDSVYTIPTRLICLRSDSTGKNVAIQDQLSSNLIYGGAKTEIMIDGQKCYQYSFSIAERLQDIITGGATDYGFFLVSYQSPEVTDRAMIAGAKRSDKFRMKLNLIYTKLP